MLCSKSLQLCLTLCDPMDCSLQGYSVHGILQARLLEWVAVSFFRGILGLCYFRGQGNAVSDVICFLNITLGNI